MANDRIYQWYKFLASLLFVSTIIYFLLNLQRISLFLDMDIFAILSAVILMIGVMVVVGVSVAVGIAARGTVGAAIGLLIGVVLVTIGLPTLLILPILALLMLLVEEKVVEAALILPILALLMPLVEEKALEAALEAVVEALGRIVRSVGVVITGTTRVVVGVVGAVEAVIVGAVREAARRVLSAVRGVEIFFDAIVKIGKEQKIYKSFILNSRFIEYIPEECQSELAVMNQQLIDEGASTRKVELQTLGQFIDILFGVYVRARLDNLWLPSKEEEIKKLDD